MSPAIYVTIAMGMACYTAVIVLFARTGTVPQSELVAIRKSYDETAAALRESRLIEGKMAAEIEQLVMRQEKDRKQIEYQSKVINGQARRISRMNGGHAA